MNLISRGIRLTNLIWQFGTAYDFFISLFVLHQPNRFGLRASWAAGVRSRLPGPQRQFLEEALEIIPPPFSWLTQPDWQPKDVKSSLANLASIPAELRLSTMLQGGDVSQSAQDTVDRIRMNQAYDLSDLESLRDFFRGNGRSVKQKTLHRFAQALSDPFTFGVQFLEACQLYYDVFFEEEERRIQHFLQRGLEDGKQLAATMPPSELFRTLSHGISYENFEKVEQLVLIPSYWSSPLVFLHNPQPSQIWVIYGCRSDEQNLIPGQYIPDALIKTLKALSDPTRLRIAHYLTQSPQTPTSLAHLLRLRPPTVIHHLNILRLAGLVEIKISKDRERCYTLRKKEVTKTIQQLDDYLNQKDPV